MRQALLQKEVDYVLEVGASGTRGYINETLIEESRNRLAERGLDPAQLVYVVDTTSGVPGNLSLSPVPRGTGIRLEIRYPVGNLLDIDRLIGIQSSTVIQQIGAGGMKMSEYVPQ
jgi:hypothetical protein